MPYEIFKEKGSSSQFEVQGIASGMSVRVAGGEKPISGVSKRDRFVVATGYGNLDAIKPEKIEKAIYQGKIVKIKFKNKKLIRLAPAQRVYARLPQKLKYYIALFKTGEKYFFKIVRGSNDIARSKFTKVWLVDVCDTKKEAQIVLKYYTVKYGIPDFELISAENREWIKALDIKKRVKATFNNMYLFEKHPHFISQTIEMEKVLFLIKFGQKSKEKNLHRLLLYTRDKGKFINLSDFKDKFIPGPKNIWYVDTAKSDYEELRLLAETIATLDDIKIINKFQILENESYFAIPASHVRSHMLLPALDGKVLKEFEVDQVKFENYKNYIYHIKIPEYGNLIVNGIVLNHKE